MTSLIRIFFAICVLAALVPGLGAQDEQADVISIPLPLPSRTVVYAAGLIAGIKSDRQQVFLIRPGDPNPKIFEISNAYDVLLYPPWLVVPTDGTEIVYINIETDVERRVKGEKLSFGRSRIEGIPFIFSKIPGRLGLMDLDNGRNLVWHKQIDSYQLQVGGQSMRSLPNRDNRQVGREGLWASPLEYSHRPDLGTLMMNWQPTPTAEKVSLHFTFEKPPGFRTTRERNPIFESVLSLKEQRVWFKSATGDQMLGCRLKFEKVVPENAPIPNLREWFTQTAYVNPLAIVGEEWTHEFKDMTVGSLQVVEKPETMTINGNRLSFTPAKASLVPQRLALSYQSASGLRKVDQMVEIADPSNDNDGPVGTGSVTVPWRVKAIDGEGDTVAALSEDGLSAVVRTAANVLGEYKFEIEQDSIHLHLPYVLVSSARDSKTTFKRVDQPDFRKSIDYKGGTIASRIADIPILFAQGAMPIRLSLFLLDEGKIPEWEVGSANDRTVKIAGFDCYLPPSEDATHRFRQGLWEAPFSHYYEYKSGKLHLEWKTGFRQEEVLSAMAAIPGVAYPLDLGRSSFRQPFATISIKDQTMWLAHPTRNEVVRIPFTRLEPVGAGERPDVEEWCAGRVYPYSLAAAGVPWTMELRGLKPDTLKFSAKPETLRVAGDKIGFVPNIRSLRPCHLAFTYEDDTGLRKVDEVIEIGAPYRSMLQADERLILFKGRTYADENGVPLLGISDKRAYLRLPGDTWQMVVDNLGGELEDVFLDGGTLYLLSEGIVIAIDRSTGHLDGVLAVNKPKTLASYDVQQVLVVGDGVGGVRALDMGKYHQTVGISARVKGCFVKTGQDVYLMSDTLHSTQITKQGKLLKIATWLPLRLRDEPPKLVAPTPVLPDIDSTALRVTVIGRQGGSVLANDNRYFYSWSPENGDVIAQEPIKLQGWEAASKVGWHMELYLGLPGQLLGYNPAEQKLSFWDLRGGSRLALLDYARGGPERLIFGLYGQTHYLLSFDRVLCAVNARDFSRRAVYLGNLDEPRQLSASGGNGDVYVSLGCAYLTIGQDVPPLSGDLTANDGSSARPKAASPEQAAAGNRGGPVRPPISRWDTNRGISPTPVARVGIPPQSTAVVVPPPSTTPPVSTAPRTVRMTATVEMERGIPVVIGTTNLPEDTLLLINILAAEEERLVASGTQRVKDGGFRSEPLGTEPLPGGPYRIRVGIAGAQRSAVENIIGKFGANLTGPLTIKRGPIVYVQYEKRFDAGTDVEVKAAFAKSVNQISRLQQLGRDVDSLWGSVERGSAPADFQPQVARLRDRLTDLRQDEPGLVEPLENQLVKIELMYRHRPLAVERDIIEIRGEYERIRNMFNGRMRDRETTLDISRMAPAQVPTVVVTDFREWVDQSGKFRVQARLEAVTAEGAVLELKTGKIITIPLEKLSEIDRGIAEQWKKP